MKKLTFLSLLLVSIHTMADKKPENFQDSISFGFDANITMAKPSKKSDVLTVKFRQSPIHEERERLEFRPGGQLVKNEIGCILQKKTQPEIDKATIRAGSNNGNVWQVKLLKKEKGESIPLLTGNIKSLFSERVLVKSKTDLYQETFEIKNSDGVSMNLICNSSCSDIQVLSKKPKLLCSEGVSGSTAQILSVLGVELPKSLRFVSQTSTATNAVANNVNGTK